MYSSSGSRVPQRIGSRGSVTRQTMTGSSLSTAGGTAGWRDLFSSAQKVSGELIGLS